ncbi:hypothetical protein Tco_0840213 [Tanacetum coccineum]|uniref:Uncharacterized protein n=1 Tax=Tanacetum coccineum TaxID=301880 RepID=A0ABQ5ASW1_9ASTR
MELENSQNNALAKLPMLKLGEYEMWEIRIKQYFQIQDYALWEVIENGNSWVPIPVTAPESGPSTALKMTVPSTTEEKICKKNDVKARSLLLMALPNEHQLTFNQYVDAQSMLQKLVSRLAILGVVTPPEDLNVKFLRSLPSKWDTHVVVWMNKLDFDTMGLDDLYNNFKIVEQKVKKSTADNNDDKNLAFLTTSSPSSTNTINTFNTGVGTGTTKVNIASTETSTASFSDATVYAFLSTQPQGSQLVHEDLEQLHDDDLEEMDLKWNMALLSMRARKFYQRTGRKIIIDGSSIVGYDKSKAVRIEDASEKAMCAIDGAGFDWSDMAEDEIQANMALMAFTDSEVSNDKSCSKSCLQNYEALKKQYDDLLVKLDDTGFKAATYKRGLSILEAQVVKYKESEVLFSEEIALLKRSVGHKEYLMGLLKTELEKVKEEKEGFEFKIAKFEKSSKDLDQLLASQITDKSKKGFGYNAVPSPHPLILNRPTPLELRLIQAKQDLFYWDEQVETVIPHTSVEEKAQRRAELKARSTLLQKLISQLEMHGEVIPQEDINQKFLRSLSQEWTIQVDILSSTTNSHNVAFLSSSSTNSATRAVNTTQGVNTASTQGSVYEEDIKLLKHEIYLRDLDIIELKMKLEFATKEKDEVQLTVQKFENSSKNLSKLLDRQIMDKCKTGLGYNVVPPPYTGNFMPPKYDLVYPSLDDFVDVSESVSEFVVEKPSVKTNKPETARKENRASIIEDWVSDSNEENVSKVKTVEMFNKPSFVKINFVKSTEQVKSPRKTSVDKNRQNTPSSRGNKRNWNQHMSQKLESNFEMFNKACHVCGSFDHLKNDCNNWYNNGRFAKPV